MVSKKPFANAAGRTHACNNEIQDASKAGGANQGVYSLNLLQASPHITRYRRRARDEAVDTHRESHEHRVVAVIRIGEVAQLIRAAKAVLLLRAVVLHLQAMSTVFLRAVHGQCILQQQLHV